jgi:hypothetical protein
VIEQRTQHCFSSRWAGRTDHGDAAPQPAIRAKFSQPVIFNAQQEPRRVMMG